MKKNYLKFLVLFILFSLAVVSDCMADSGVYVGGHIRRERPGTITKLKESGFNYVILFNINVETDGTLKTDGETICSNGQYVFGNTQPNYVSDIKSLKTSPTNINRIEVCIGGWGNTSYTNIKNIIASQGTGSGSILYRNFQALKNAIPEIDAVNNDDEYTYDVNSSSAFHVMMADLGYKTTLAPYTNKTHWQNLATSINYARSGAVDRILLQCYDGGAGNNPSDWHINNIPLHAGRQNYDDFAGSKSLMQSWKDNSGVVGGFFWVYNDETWNLNTYATAVNRIFGPKTTNAAVATFCSDINYGGYNIGLPIGSFTTSDLAAYGITNDDISSCKVNSGYKITAYTDNSFGGTTTSYTSDQSNVGSTYNDQISSIRVYKNTTNPAATFYPDVNYGGFPVSLPQGTFTVDELSAYGIKNDDITSLKVNQDYRVVLYTDNNFGGTSVTYTSDQGWIGDYNDKVSSIKIYKYAADAVANFYNADNSQGAFVGLPLGSYTLSDLKEYGIDDNSITSFDLTSGYRVVLYADDNFSGSFASYTAGQGWLGDLNDKTSSIQIYKYSNSPASTFYSNINYGGLSVGLPLGTYTTSELASYGILNDDITSLKVNAGYRVIVYMDNNFSGTSVSYTSDQSWIGDYNDKVSSIEIYKYSADVVANFYNADNSQGSSVGLPMGSFTLSALKEYGIDDNSITSFDLTEGYRVVLYSDDNFSGLSTSYTAGQGWLGDLNDKTSSIQIYKYSADAVANFYNSDNSQGAFTGLSTGLFTTTEMLKYGIADNSITSFDLQSGYQVVIYADDNFSGSSTSYTTGQGWLYDLNDNTSSIKIYPVFGSDITDNGGVLTASHTAVSSAETLDKLTDNNAVTKYCANAAAGGEVWMKYQSPVSVFLQSYSLTSANDSQGRDPKAWQLQGSDNGTDWTDINTQTGQVFNRRYSKKSFAVSTTNAYKYFRLLVTERYDGSATIFQLAEFQLFGEEQTAAKSNRKNLFVENLNANKDNQINQSDLRIYPNPAVSYIQVDMPAEKYTVNYIVYSTLGVSVQSGQLSNGESINVQSLTPGAYQLVLTNNGQRTVRQFLKNNK